MCAELTEKISSLKQMLDDGWRVDMRGVMELSNAPQKVEFGNKNSRM